MVVYLYAREILPGWLHGHDNVHEDLLKQTDVCPLPLPHHLNSMV